MLYGRVKTYDYLHQLRMGPNTLCVLCGLEYQTIEHLYNFCPKSQVVWALIGDSIDKHISFQNGIISSNWLSYSQAKKSIFVQSIIATIVRFIWKPRWNCIFKYESLDCNAISKKIVAYVKEYYSIVASHHGKCLFLSNFQINIKYIFIISSTLHGAIISGKQATIITTRELIHGLILLKID